LTVHFRTKWNLKIFKHEKKIMSIHKINIIKPIDNGILLAYKLLNNFWFILLQINYKSFRPFEIINVI
jgi:hypothetical protein